MYWSCSWSEEDDGPEFDADRHEGDVGEEENREAACQHLTTCFMVAMSNTGGLTGPTCAAGVTAVAAPASAIATAIPLCCCYCYHHFCR